MSIITEIDIGSNCNYRELYQPLFYSICDVKEIVDKFNKDIYPIASKNVNLATYENLKYTLECIYEHINDMNAKLQFGMMEKRFMKEDIKQFARLYSNIEHYFNELSSFFEIVTDEKSYSFDKGLFDYKFLKVSGIDELEREYIKERIQQETPDCCEEPYFLVNCGTGYKECKNCGYYDEDTIGNEEVVEESYVDTGVRQTEKNKKSNGKQFQDLVDSIQGKLLQTADISPLIERIIEIYRAENMHSCLTTHNYLTIEETIKSSKIKSYFNPVPSNYNKVYYYIPYIYSVLTGNVLGTIKNEEQDIINNCFHWISLMYGKTGEAGNSIKAPSSSIPKKIFLVKLLQKYISDKTELNRLISVIYINEQSKNKRKNAEYADYMISLYDKKDDYML